jgi:hypothetical protein
MTPEEAYTEALRRIREAEDATALDLSKLHSLKQTLKNWRGLSPCNFSEVGLNAQNRRRHLARVYRFNFGNWDKGSQQLF